MMTLQLYYMIFLCMYKNMELEETSPPHRCCRPRGRSKLLLKLLGTPSTDELLIQLQSWDTEVQT